jgi:PTS system mannose-specific IID component
MSTEGGPGGEPQLGFWIRLQVFLRSFAIQGSWNYRTLLGAGFAFALLPVLRHVYRDRSALHAAVARQTGLFNSHPYLAGIALGAVARLEAEGASPDLIERFKAALRGSLGQLGDRLVWAGWRPACIALALVLLLAGAPWWAAVGAFLVIYNVGHIALRWWALSIGFATGRQVAERVRNAGLEGVRDRIASAGALGIGAALPLLIVRGVGADPVPLWGSVLAAIAAVLGVRYGSAVRRPALTALVLLIAVGFLLKVTQ